MKTEILERQMLRGGFPLNPLLGMARNLLRKKVSELPVGTIILHDELDVETPVVNTDAIIISVNDMRFYIDVMLAGSNGAASAYRDGFWSCNNLTGLFQLMVRNLDTLDKLEGGFASIGNWWLKRRHKSRSNTRNGSRQNIHAHYDLGNEFFELMLDPTMTYSSGYFLSEKSNMEEASIEKLDRICRKLNLQINDHVVEIGTGWGSFAIHAASHYGCRVTTTTISKEQFKFASERIRKLGLQDKIDIRFSDYRDLCGKYDKLVSIEMIEAVGHDFLPAYFSACSNLLKENGQACIQAITMPDHRYDQYLKNSDFIQQFIFPGSCVPSITAIQNAITKGSDLRISQLEDFGQHYARTLDQWRRTFISEFEAIENMGYSEDFNRLWEYYLCYCEAGFLERYTGVIQFVLDKPGSGRKAIKKTDLRPC